MLATGTIGVAAAGDVLLGSLNGVFYTDASTSKPTWANHLEASNTATDIVGFVADDPYERFEIQSNNAGSSLLKLILVTVLTLCTLLVASPNYISKVEIG